MRRVTGFGAVGLLVLGLAGTAAPAWAATSTEIVQGRVIRLVSVADWDAASSMTAGSPVQWDVTVSADAPDPGRVTLGLSAVGEAPLVIDAALCLQEWASDGTCPAGERVLRQSWAIPRDGNEIDLVEVSDTDIAHVRLTVELAAGAAVGSTDIRFHARGASESAVVGPGGGLATTGLSPVVPWILGGGAVLVVLGILLTVLRSRRGRSEADSGDEGDDRETSGGGS